jgi:hypothetical protein
MGSRLLYRLTAYHLALVFAGGILIGIAAFKRNMADQRAAAEKFMGGGFGIASKARRIIVDPGKLIGTPDS